LIYNQVNNSQATFYLLFIATNIEIIILTNKFNFNYLKIIFKKNIGIGVRIKKGEETGSLPNFTNKKKPDLKIKKTKKIVVF